MNTDIRLSVGFWQHPKTRKTAKRLGLEGIRALQILWSWAAQNRPDGNLSSLDWEDIEMAADWQGEEKAFFDYCLGVWIDEVAGSYALHDWKDHNSWASEADERSDKARFSRLATANREAYDKLKAVGINAISKEEYDRLTTVQRPPDDRQTTVARSSHVTPTPAPSPALTHKDKERGDSAHAHVAPFVPEIPPEQFQGDIDDLSPAESGSAVLVQPFSEPPADVSQSTGPKRTDCPSKGHPQWRAFMSCWQVYPVQQGQEAAWREWMRLHCNGTLPDVYAVRDAILTLAQEDSRWQRGKIPNMAKWLNGKGWNDTPFVEPAQQARDGPPVARTQAQRNRQNLEGMAAFVRAADKELEHGYEAENLNGIGAHGRSLPAGVGR
ncbi:MAG: hypothetical protein RBR41_02320 [Desulfovibrio sp.]|uniref:hypothetical protein n=1 Tax=Desulfovibrio sp. TaxID=885 RepID=UPI002A370406|nr:hypothetical protein [Desulfovibrio sp.]MDY0258486.1 hypothetical protein [Desulfovibrio sp.]